MKKYVFLFLAMTSLLISSCSDGDETPEDPAIVGTWVLTDTSLPPELYNPQACTSESTITFNEDQTASSEFYLENNGCEATTEEGTWEKLEGSTYVFSVPQLGTLEGDVDFTGNDQFVFSADATYGGFTAPVKLYFEKQ